MPRVGFEPVISVSRLLNTLHSSDRSTTVIADKMFIATGKVSKEE